MEENDTMVAFLRTYGILRLYPAFQKLGMELADVLLAQKEDLNQFCAELGLGAGDRMRLNRAIIEVWFCYQKSNKKKINKNKNKNKKNMSPQKYFYKVYIVKYEFCAFFVIDN